MPLSHLDDLPKPKTTELLQKGMESVQEYSALDEREEVRRWRVFRIGDQEHRVDMKAIEPYKRVISHGGQCYNRHTHINTTTLSMSIFNSKHDEAAHKCLHAINSLCDIECFIAGYYGDGLNAIIVFAVCFMPESNQPNYRYIMDNLFKWVSIWLFLVLWANTLEPLLMGFFSSQVCHWHTGAFGCWELYDCVFEWGNLSEKDANCRMAQKVLSADW